MAEQKQLTEEDLKKMSPEQLLELQKQNCIFCHIRDGKVASKKVYEDEQCFGILDINPANPGHVLLIPKAHVTILPQLSEEHVAYLAKVIKRLGNIMLKTLGAKGVTTMIPNGMVAGQRASHLVIHVIPRKEDDKVGMDLPNKPLNAEQMRKVREKLQLAINKVFSSSFDVPPHVQSEGKNDAVIDVDDTVEIEDVEDAEKDQEKKGEDDKKTDEVEGNGESNLDSIANFLAGK